MTPRNREVARPFLFGGEGAGWGVFLKAAVWLEVIDRARVGGTGAGKSEISVRGSYFD